MWAGLVNIVCVDSAYRTNHRPAGALLSGTPTHGNATAPHHHTTQHNITLQHTHTHPFLSPHNHPTFPSLFSNLLLPHSSSHTPPHHTTKHNTATHRCRTTPDTSHQKPNSTLRATMCYPIALRHIAEHPRPKRSKPQAKCSITCTKLTLSRVGVSLHLHLARLRRSLYKVPTILVCLAPPTCNPDCPRNTLNVQLSRHAS